MLSNCVCAWLMGFFFMFPCLGYAQKRLPPLKYTPKVAPRVPSVPCGDVAGKIIFGARVPVGTVHSPLAFKFVPFSRAVARSCAQGWLSPNTGLPLYRVRDVFPGKADIDAVIFDLDGTLLDSLSAWEHSGSNFVRTQGFEPPNTLDDELVSLSLLDGARLIKERYGLDQSLEEILALTLRPIRAHYHQDILPMPQVPALLASLKEQGIRMVVATASDRELAEVSLQRLGLRDYFEFIITCDEVGVGKSSPKVYEEALRRLGTPKYRTLVAEDALHALQTAHEAGFPTAGIEEAHSAAQRAAKKEVSTYYVSFY